MIVLKAMMHIKKIITKIKCWTCGIKSGGIHPLAEIKKYGNVEVGKGCVIGANAVVTKDIPDYCVVVGNPARIVKQYDFKEKKWI